RRYGNILGDDKQQQVLALGRRLAAPPHLRAMGVRSETASVYLKAAGIPVRGPRQRRPPREIRPVRCPSTLAPLGPAGAPAALEPSPAGRAPSEVATPWQAGRTSSTTMASPGGTYLTTQGAWRATGEEQW